MAAFDHPILPCKQGFAFVRFYAHEVGFTHKASSPPFQLGMADFKNLKQRLNLHGTEFGGHPLSKEGWVGRKKGGGLAGSETLEAGSVAPSP
jgi:hypothetical protein